MKRYKNLLIQQKGWYDNMIKKENQMMQEAYKEGYAIPAFNYSDVWELLAIQEAASELEARVYVASNMKVVGSLGVEICGALGRQVYRNMSGSVMHHLDHATETEYCLKAVDNGYMSVMVDASACELDENIRRVKAVVDYANPKGVLVEAEIGKIMGNNDEGKYSGADFLADVDEAIRLVKETKVNSLAVGIGNAHGFYKAPPELNIQRLKEINEALGIPLVLHGGTGIPADQVKESIANGIAKVNVGTLLHSTYLKQLRTELDVERVGFNLAEIFQPVKEAVKEEVKNWILLCGSDHRA